MCSGGESIVQHSSTCYCHFSMTEPVAVADRLFSQLVVLDYYDGPAGGFLRCDGCGDEYHFYMLDWDSSQNVRIFALAPLPPATLERLFDVLEARPDRRVWIPPIFSRASEEQLSELYAGGIQDAIERAGTPRLVIAWSIPDEKTLAVRGVDAASASHLSPWFDRQATDDSFDWFRYLGLAALRLV